LTGPSGKKKKKGGDKGRVGGGILRQAIPREKTVLDVTIGLGKMVREKGENA